MNTKTGSMAEGTIMITLMDRLPKGTAAEAPDRLRRTRFFAKYAFGNVYKSAYGSTAQGAIDALRAVCPDARKARILRTR